jgi:hypothetical protein
MDGSGAWWNHNGHPVMHSKSLMTSTKNPRGWKWGFPTQCWVEHGWVEHGQVL